MKNTAWLFCFIFAFAQSLYAQSAALAAFNTLLRDLDLNAETQNGYAISAAEYDTLLAAWQKLEAFDKLELRGALLLGRHFCRDAALRFRGGRNVGGTRAEDDEAGRAGIVAHIEPP